MTVVAQAKGDSCTESEAGGVSDWDLRLPTELGGFQEILGERW